MINSVLNGTDSWSKFVNTWLLKWAKITTYPIYLLVHWSGGNFWSNENTGYLMLAYWFILIPQIPFGIITFILFPLVIFSEVYMW